MKQYTEHIRGKLRKLPKKLIGSLAAAAVVVTTLVTANPMAVQAGQRDPNVNPQINIQHYLNFEAISMGFITDGPDTAGKGTVVYPLRNAPDWDKSFSWSEFEKKYQTLPDTEKGTATGTLLKIYNKEAGGTLTNGAGSAPKYGLILDEQGNMETHPAKKMLFNDETVEYRNKPQLLYMNRLANNENYKLKAVWFAKTLANPRSVDEKDFKIANITADLNSEYPVIFTNNENYSETINGVTIKASADEPVRMGDHWVIVVSEGATIRFMFDPTDETYNKNDVNFFDYDISNGKIYVNGVEHETSEQDALQAAGNTTTAHTGKQGINSDKNYSGTGAKLAFGNVNTGTGLGGEIWDGNAINQFNRNNDQGTVFGLVQGLNSDGTLQWADGVDAPKLFSTANDTVGKSVYQNKYGLQFKRSGGTYVLDGVTDLKSGSVIESAKDLSTFEGLKVPNSTNRNKVIWSNQFWPMDAAPSYGANDHDLKFGATSKPGTYGEVNTSGQWDNLTNTKNAFRGQSSPAGNTANGGDVGAGSATGSLPKSDDSFNHNSNFGMSFTTDFYLDPGYAGPLRYYFYGDDDMFVFLSRVTTDEQNNEIVSEPQLVADVGGVHSSVGMYVNLWPYVNGGNGPIAYPANSQEKSSQVQHYRLSVFYTERGESGSTCFMRLTVPFEPNDPGSIAFNADLNVEKEVKSAESDETAADKEYTFQLKLKNGGTVPELDDDGNPVLNAEGNPVTRPATFDESNSVMVNQYAYTIKDKATGKEVSSGYIANDGTFKLKDGQLFTVKDLPQGSLYKVEEIQLNSGETTTFVSGKIDKDGATHIQKDYAAGTVVSGSTVEENYVKYINAAQQGTLTLNKTVEGTPSTTEPFTFQVKLEAPEGFTGPIGSLGVLRNGLEEADLQPEEDGSYLVALQWDADKKAYDTVTLYNIPLKTAYTVTEQKTGNYLPFDIEVTGGVDNQTFLATATAQGIIDVDGEISDTNRPFVTVNYTNTYQPSATAQLKVNKTITGRPAASGGEQFTFRLEGADDQSKAYLGDKPLFAEVTVKAGEKNAEGLFPEMHFTKEDLKLKTYRFNITEVNGGQHVNDLDYDASVYQAAITVSTDDDFNLKTSVAWTKDGADYEPAGDADGAIGFENIRRLTASGDIGFTKTIEGDGNIGDVYRFTIDGEDGAPMPEETTVEIVNDGSTVYTGKFGPIAFADKDAGKSYTYTIKETANIAGMVTDPTVYKATYKIGKKTDGNGYDQLDPQLTITREDGSAADTAGVVFKNIYRKAEVAIPVTKTLQGRQMRPDETFVFELLEKGSSDVLQTLTIQGEEGKNSVTKSFEPIQFMDAAVKEYIVREIRGSDPQMTYDTADHAVTVTVTETAEKNLETSIQYEGDTQQNSVVITNIWNTSADWAPEVSKQTLGGSPEGYTFRMEMTEAEGAELPESVTATSDAQGMVRFDPVTFTRAGTYTVKVQEVKGNDDSVEYDGHTVTWTVAVAQDEKTGAFTVTPATDDSTLFTNDAGLRISKTVTAGTDTTLTEADLTREFSFTLSFRDSQGKDLAGSWKTVIRNMEGDIVSDDQTVSSKGTLKLRHGQTAYIYGLPAGTSYSIDEQPEAGWFNVEALHGEGSISAGNVQDVSFTNVKMGTDTGEILGYKSLINTGMNPNLTLDQFQFSIEGIRADVEDTPKVPVSKEETPEEEQAEDGQAQPAPGQEESESMEPEPADEETQQDPEAEQVVMPRKAARSQITLEPGEMPLPEVTTVSSNAAGEIRFGAIEFTRAGTYVYRISEVNNSLDGVSYSDAQWTATVTVENVFTSGQVTGVKVTDIAYADAEGNPADAFAFTNEYKGTPDLELHKDQSVQGGDRTTEKQSVKAGDLVTYYLTVSAPETATAAARDVVITDVIPSVNQGGDPDAQLKLVNPGGASYDEKTRTLTWHVGDLTPGNAVTVFWTVLVPEVKTETSWTNIAAANYSNNPDDPLESEEVTIETEPALPHVTIRKAQSVNKPGAVSTSDFSENEQPVLTEAGSKVIYRLTVTNDGDAAAKNVIITDVIPKAADGTQLEFLQVYDDGVFDRKTQTLTWTLPELKAGESANVHFAVTVPTVKTATQWTNQATVKHQDPKDPTKETPEVPSNEVTVETDVPALTIHKEQALNSSEEKDFTTVLLSARPGDIITYRMTVTNPSKVDVPNVVVKDTVPIGTPEAPLAVVSGSVSEGGNHYADGTIVWNLGMMQAGESRSVSFQVKVPVVTGSTKWTNVATVTTPQDPDDPTPSNPVDSEAKAPELKLEKFQNFEDMAPTGDKLTGQAKEEIVTYTLKASNTGEYKAENVIITDEIPAGTTLVEGSISVGGTRSGNVITWKLGDIEPGEAHAKSVTFQVKLNKISEATTWRNVAAAVYDNNPENPEDPKDPKTPVPSNEVEIEADVPALSIVKSQRRNDEEPATPILVEAGDTITYALTVTSTGKSAAQDVVIKDPVPEGLELIEGSISDGGKAENGVITWNVGTMDPGAEKTVTFKVRVPQVKEATTWINAASTTYSNREDPEDPIPSNEVEVKKDPNKVPTTSTNGKPHPGASAPTATNTGILTWTLLAAGAATGAAGLGIAGRRRRKPVSRKRK